MENNISGKCPVCLSSETGLLKVIKDQPALCNVLSITRQDALNAPRGDISLTLCRSCGHAFNSSYDESIIRYTEDYENSLHFSCVFQGYARELARGLVEKYSLHGGHILEIGCGKGDFLRMICEAGKSTGTGFDSSYQGNRDAVKDGIEFVKDACGSSYSGRKGDLVVTRHVLEHVPSPRDFCVLLREAVQEGGNLFIEVPDSAPILKGGGIWDIIYEHYSYFSESSLRRLLEESGLFVREIYKTFNGQFLCAEASISSGREKALRPADESMRLSGEDLFSDIYCAIAGRWKKILGSLREKGGTGALWGAGSKGVSFLNVLGAREEIKYVIDINPYKEGKFIPGSGHMITGPASIKSHPPDFVIIMNGAYSGEIARALHEMNVKAEILQA